MSVAEGGMGAEWTGAEREPLASDASARSYERLRRPGGRSAILMRDASPGGIAAFVRAAGVLCGHGPSIPDIHARDDARGLLVLEDFGDVPLARLMRDAPDRTPDLVACAVDAIADLQAARVPNWALPFARHPLTPVQPAADHYAAAAPPLWPEIEAELARLRRRHADGAAVIVHRDYHAENLMWLPDRDATARIGVLDFQDMLAGPPAYDLVSLLQDARRDLPGDLERRMIDRFTERTGRAPDAFAAQYAVIGAHRHLRLLGVLARLGRQPGKDRYLAFLPRVWRQLVQALAHPELGRLRALVAGALAPPDMDP